MAGMFVHFLTILLIVETFLLGTEGLGGLAHMTPGNVLGRKRAKMVSIFN